MRCDGIRCHFQSISNCFHHFYFDAWGLCSIKIGNVEEDRSSFCNVCFVMDDEHEGAVPFCWPECGLNLHPFEALCNVPPWHTSSPSAPQCASGSPGAAPLGSSS